MFSLVGRLPSMPSANGFPFLFGHFVGTVRPSDSPATCMLDFWFMTFSNRPAHEIVTGVAGASRLSRMEFPCMLGVSDCAESFESSRWRFHQCGLPSRWTTSALRIDLFRSSMSRLHVPLSTLHEQPCDWPRMTRGQGGSLRLPCVTLSFTTPYRFLPAHPPGRAGPHPAVQRVTHRHRTSEGDQANRSKRWEARKTGPDCSPDAKGRVDCPPFSRRD